MNHLNAVPGKPQQKLPLNAIRAREVAKINAHSPLALDLGVFSAAKPNNRLTLMSWGQNYDRAAVEAFGSRRFVWVGICQTSPDDLRRDNFEEIL